MSGFKNNKELLVNLKQLEKVVSSSSETEEWTDDWADAWDINECANGSVGSDFFLPVYNNTKAIEKWMDEEEVKKEKK